MTLFKTNVLSLWSFNTKMCMISLGDMAFFKCNRKWELRVDYRHLNKDSMKAAQCEFKLAPPCLTIMIRRRVYHKEVVLLSSISYV